MNEIEHLYTFLVQFPELYLTTQEQGQPHILPIRNVHLENGRLYVIGCDKETLQRLNTNPKAALLAVSGQQQLRMEGRLLIEDSRCYFRSAQAELVSPDGTSQAFHISAQRPFENVYGKLIVSCQALPEEPLHSSVIMARMAEAARRAGAAGIRANSTADIQAIRTQVDLPIIGIIKAEYPDSPVYITPTMKEIDALVSAGPDVIALDATDRLRPGNISLADFVAAVRSRYPQQKLMADCSTPAEIRQADELGFDYIGTTLVGYTEASRGHRIEENDFEWIRQALEQIHVPLIAEGNIDTPEKARRVLDLGCFSVVVGSAITRPQNIAARFTAALEKEGK